MVRPNRRAVPALIGAFLLSLFTIFPASANNVAQTLPFSQTWTNTSCSTSTMTGPDVPAGVEGFLGQGLTSANDVDPQTVLGESTFRGTSTSSESDRSCPSRTAASPNSSLPIPCRVTGLGHGRCALPSVPSQYRVARTSRSRITSATSTGPPMRTSSSPCSSAPGTAAISRTFPPATSPTRRRASAASLVTPVSAVLPAGHNQPLLQVRVITTKPSETTNGWASTTSRCGRIPDPRRPDTDAHADGAHPHADADSDTDSPTPPPAAIKISQVYGGGGGRRRDPVRTTSSSCTTATEADVLACRLVSPVRRRRREQHGSRPL